MTVKPQLTIEKAFHEALAFHQSHEYVKAEQIYRQLLRVSPDQGDVIYLLAEVCKQTKRFGEAAELIDRAIFLVGDKSEYHFTRGEILEGLDRSEEAIKSLEQALALDASAYMLGKVLPVLIGLMLPGPTYQEILTEFHNTLFPDAYLEIGVDNGKSLAIANPPTVAIGVDPKPHVTEKLSDTAKVIIETSDNFFANYNVVSELGNRRIDLAFIDGMHLFEFALKDFINIERNSKRQSIILIHDCYPLEKITASRDRQTKLWSGDIWKIIPCLKKYRPDLAIATIPTRPTGLGIVTNLDPSSSKLQDNFDEILSEYVPLGFETLKDNRDNTLNRIPNDWSEILQFISEAHE